RWLRDMILPDIYAECKKTGKNFFAYSQKEMDPENPGKLLLLPHFSGSGNPFFKADALGAIYGFSLDTTREDIARAVYEGLAYEVRLHTDEYKKAGIELDTLRAVGGGATIDAQLQLKANITGLKIIKGTVSESSAMGAAAYAAVGAGIIANPAEAYEKVKGGEKVFVPDPLAHARFEKKFEKYRELAYMINTIDGE
ncbi:MAG: hypothetical protein IJL97_04885, partial [Lachnospiraceae bacterium]|nr:hypothetical protein [Lachnospiraceae bacterium]